MKATSSPRSVAAVDRCDMKSKCLWPSYGMYTKCHDKLPYRGCGLSTTLLYYIMSFIFFSIVGVFYAWLAFSPYKNISDAVSTGCQPDNEGSWSIGLFRGSSPFSLKPIEMVIILSLSLSVSFFPSLPTEGQRLIKLTK